MKTSLRMLVGRVLLLAIALGVPNSYASKERPLIGLSLDSFKDERWQRDRDAFVAAVELLGGKVIVQSADMDDGLQAQQVQAMAQRGVELLHRYRGNRRRSIGLLQQRIFDWAGCGSDRPERR